MKQTDLLKKLINKKIEDCAACIGVDKNEIPTLVGWYTLADGHDIRIYIEYKYVKGQWLKIEEN